MIDLYWAEDYIDRVELLISLGVIKQIDEEDKKG
jgi:hypothetical protein